MEGKRLLLLDPTVCELLSLLICSDMLSGCFFLHMDISSCLEQHSFEEHKRWKPGNDKYLCCTCNLLYSVYNKPCVVVFNGLCILCYANSDTIMQFDQISTERERERETITEKTFGDMHL